MGRFLSELDVRQISKHRWLLLRPLRYEHDGKLYVIPRGFITDFASVPRLPLVYSMAGDTGHRAAVLHDWLYRVQICSRARADRLFRIALQDDGEPAWRAWMMWAGVRAGGFFVWRKYEKDIRRSAVA